MNPRISLLHATYHRAGGPLIVRDAWLARADNPGDVEYVFAMDADDDGSIKDTDGCLRVIGQPAIGMVTAVRNWNNAATAATGDLLMVVADDLFPPHGLDSALLDLITPLDPLTAEFAVKVSDSADDSRVLLRHPVMSRAFYEQHGLFDDAYRGVYCDDDITRRAFWRAAILDGRSIVLHHQHPSLDKTLQKSESQSRINSKHEYRHGREQYLAAWRPQQRLAQVRLVETGESSRLSSSNLRRVARLDRALAIIVYRRCQLYRRLKHPLSTARGLKRRFSRRGRRMTGR